VAERERARRNPWRDGAPVNAPTRDVTPAWTPAGVLEGAPASTLAQLQTAVGNRGFSSLVAAHVQRQVAVDTGIVGLKARDGIDQGTVDRRPRVTDLQAQLNRRVGAGLSPDGMWGQKTSGAVHRAQLLAGLAVADVIDQALADFLAGGAPATPVRSGAAMLVGLRKGDGLDADKLDVTNRVKFLQTKLGEQGFPTNVDGRWGAKTDAALRAFQTANSLTPGSPIDAATAEALLGAAQTTAIDPGSSSVLGPGVNREERPFGTFVVLPDGKTAADFPTLRLDPTVEVMAAADFARIQALWDELVAGTGTIQIGSIDPDGKAVPAFRDKMLGRLGTLLSRPTGRRVINEIHELGRLLLIAPDRLFDAPRGQPRASGPVTERDTGRGLAPRSATGWRATARFSCRPISRTTPLLRSTGTGSHSRRRCSRSWATSSVTRCTTRRDRTARARLGAIPASRTARRRTLMTSRTRSVPSTVSPANDSTTAGAEDGRQTSSD
jgi:peptidoglycan hydrolase-like protein with peptidoglycan-binding domain